MSLRCRLGMHAWMVRWRTQVTPLWASQMLLAVDGMRECFVFCKRCGRQ